MILLEIKFGKNYQNYKYRLSRSTWCSWCRNRTICLWL